MVKRSWSEGPTHTTDGRDKLDEKSPPNVDTGVTQLRTTVHKVNFPSTLFDTRRPCGETGDVMTIAVTRRVSADSSAAPGKEEDNVLLEPWPGSRPATGVPGPGPPAHSRTSIASIRLMQPDSSAAPGKEEDNVLLEPWPGSRPATGVPGPGPPAHSRTSIASIRLMQPVPPLVLTRNTSRRKSSLRDSRTLRSVCLALPPGQSPASFWHCVVCMYTSLTSFITTALCACMHAPLTSSISSCLQRQCTRR